jgi:hypothetical protein
MVGLVDVARWARGRFFLAIASPLSRHPLSMPNVATATAADASK